MMSSLTAVATAAAGVAIRAVIPLAAVLAVVAPQNRRSQQSRSPRVLSETVTVAVVSVMVPVAVVAVVVVAHYQ
jgi:hypothetical protein